MKLGILTDAHLGFHRYSRTTATNINRRESDFYRAYITAIENLVNADVEAIVDLGDLADSPHPRKRAVQCLIQTISAIGIPYYAVDGNHTKVRVSGDIHLYDLLYQFCDNFRGYTDPTYVEAIDALLIPYGSSDEIKDGLTLVEHEPAFIGGHFACEDVLPDGHDISVGDLPDIPVLLGHYHGRSYQAGPVCKCINDGSYTHEHSELRVGSTFVNSPVYIGATERGKWGEWRNPAGAAVYDTDTSELTFIDHPVRQWIDLSATAEDYLEVVDEAMKGRDDQPIVRLTIATTHEQYRSINALAARRIATNALDLSIRRVGTGEEAVAVTEPVEFGSLAADWRKQVAGADLPKSINRSAVEAVGVDALSAVGVAV